MTTNPKNQNESGPSVDTDQMVLDLAKIAFGNIYDFTQFGNDGVIDIDYVKAREAGATVSVITRKVGRGKNARQVRSTTIKMPNKLRALISLGKHLGLFTVRRK